MNGHVDGQGSMPAPPSPREQSAQLADILSKEEDDWGGGGTPKSCTVNRIMAYNIAF